MRIKFISSCLVVGAMFLGSCSTPKNVAYFPELETGSIVQAQQVMDIKVKPEDKISISVNTQDPALSALFNLSGGSSTSSGGSEMSSYTVDSYGDINFPVLGKLHVAGLNREQIAERITDKLIKDDLVKNPIVIVEFANTGIVILGEIKNPGRYEFNKDHFTILDAIAEGGDLTMNGMRENILVMRNIGDGKREAYRVNLLNAQELASSPVYYLQQDDLIYVEPNNKTKRNTTESGNSVFNPTFWLSMTTSLLSIISIVLTITTRIK